MCEEKRNMRRKKKKRGGKREIFSLSLSISHLFLLSFSLCAPSLEIYQGSCHLQLKKKNCNNVHIILFFATCVLEKDSKGEKGRIMDENKTLKVGLVKGRAVKKEKVRRKKRDEEVVAKESCKKKNGTVFSEDKKNSLFSPCAICRRLLVSLLRKKTFFFLLLFPPLLSSLFSLFSFLSLSLSMREREREKEREAPCSLIVLLCESSFFSSHGGGKEV
jgi:hypothetical protein